MKLVLIVFTLLLALLIVLHSVRWMDNRMALKVWRALETGAPQSVQAFSVDMVEDLPDPARRFFLYMIKPGTPLHTVVEIDMDGELGLGPKDAPGYMPMEGIQLLAPPNGFVWRVKARKGPLTISGHEGADIDRSWLRFWLLGTLPVARGGENPDHYRAAFGRVVSEAVFWTPAALLPQNGVDWIAVGSDTARATIKANGLEQSVDITVNQDGQPQKVIIERWSDANPKEIYQPKPFGGYLSEFREFDGFTLPTRVEGGNFIGTDDYFPFYKAHVTSIRFIDGRISK